MKGFRNIAEKMIQMRQGRQANPPPMSSEMGRGILKGSGGFGNMIKNMMQKRQMQDKPNMTTAGPNPMPGAMKKGGVVKSASKRADGCVKMARGGGCEIRGKTKGKFV